MLSSLELLFSIGQSPSPPESTRGRSFLTGDSRSSRRFPVPDTLELKQISGSHSFGFGFAAHSYLLPPVIFYTLPSAASGDETVDYTFLNLFPTLLLLSSNYCHEHPRLPRLQRHHPRRPRRSRSHAPLLLQRLRQRRFHPHRRPEIPLRRRNRSR